MKSKVSMLLGNVSECWTTTATIGKPQEQAAFPDVQWQKGSSSSMKEDDHKIPPKVGLLVGTQKKKSKGNEDTPWKGRLQAWGSQVLQGMW